MFQLWEARKKIWNITEAEIPLRTRRTAQTKALFQEKLGDKRVRVPPLPYIRHELFLMADAHASLYKMETANRLRRSPVCEIGATRSQVWKTAHPQLTGSGTPPEGGINEEEAAAIAAAAAMAQIVKVIPMCYFTVRTSTLRPFPTRSPEIRCFSRFRSVRRCRWTSQLCMTSTPMGISKWGRHRSRSRSRGRQFRLFEVDGCTVKSKYWIVRVWEREACGIDHLHILERQLGLGRSRLKAAVELQVINVSLELAI